MLSFYTSAYFKNNYISWLSLDSELFSDKWDWMNDSRFYYKSNSKNGYYE